MYGGRTASDMDEIEKCYDEQEEKAAARRKKVRIMSAVIVVLVIVLITIICLEVRHPITAPLPVPRNISTKVHSLKLPDHVLSHRQGFHDNTHIRLVHEVQKHLNVSNCWLCSRLPQSATGGLQSVSEPVPANTTVVALFVNLMYRNEVLGLSFYSQFAKDKEYDSAVTIEYYGIWLYGGTVARQRKGKIPEGSVPYRRLIDPDSGNEKTLLEDCANALDAPSDSCPKPMRTHLTRAPPLCFKKDGARNMGTTSNCVSTLELPSSQNYAVWLYLGPSLYFICGTKVYTWLPQEWSGTCFVSLLFPDVLPVKTEDLHLLALPTAPPASMIRQKRSSEWSYTVKDFVKGLVPMYGITENSHAIHELATLLARSANVSATAFAAMSAELRALKLISTQNRLGIDLVFAKQGGLCKVIGVQCCLFVPSSSKTVSDSIKQLHEISNDAQDVQKSMEEWPAVTWLTDKWYSWGWKILIVIVAILAAGMVLCVCIQCLPVLCAKAADSAIPSRQFPSRQIEDASPSVPAVSAPLNIDPKLSSYGHVPGYGNLPAILQHPPRLMVRHLYEVHVAPSSPPEYSEQDSGPGSVSASVGALPKVAPAIYRLRTELCT